MAEQAGVADAGAILPQAEAKSPPRACAKGPQIRRCCGSRQRQLRRVKRACFSGSFTVRAPLHVASQTNCSSSSRPGCTPKRLSPGLCGREWARRFCERRPRCLCCVVKQTVRNQQQRMDGVEQTAPHLQHRSDAPGRYLGGLLALHGPMACPFRPLAVQRSSLQLGKTISSSCACSDRIGVDHTLCNARAACTETLVCSRVDFRSARKHR